MDFLEFNVIERIEGLLQGSDSLANLMPLQRRALNLREALERVDDALFARLREGIREGRLRREGFRGMLAEYFGPDSNGYDRKVEVGYDSLDTFINGVLHQGPIPAETKAREAEMVYYQKTPARIVLEMAEKARLTEADIFYDLGSGLGQVPILIHLLSGAAAKGIEFEPAYCDYARACAADLNLARVEFMHADARASDYSDGTVFFLYTPFEGGILATVLEKLRREARKRIRIFTYGPCTQQVSRQNWLLRTDDGGGEPHQLAGFESR
ncbi:MAG: class I SAM-dependent methyltransferase [Fibrobacteria bacterium]